MPDNYVIEDSDGVLTIRFDVQPSFEDIQNAIHDVRAFRTRQECLDWLKLRD